MAAPVVTRALLASCATALALAGCGLQQDLSQRPQTGAGPARAPAIDAPTLSGSRLDWSALRGHPVVLDFWASWCGPCRAEQHDINTLAATYAPRGVVFLGVDMRDDDAGARAYERDFHVTYQSVVDPDEQISAMYAVAAPPTLIVVDSRGRIAGTYLGTVVGVADRLRELT